MSREQNTSRKLFILSPASCSKRVTAHKLSISSSIRISCCYYTVHSAIGKRFFFFFLLSSPRTKPPTSRIQLILSNQVFRSVRLRCIYNDFFVRSSGWDTRMEYIGIYLLRGLIRSAHVMSRTAWLTGRKKGGKTV